VEPEVPAEQDEALKAELMAEGEPLFQTHCAACHGAELEGGEGPKLASSRSVGQNGVVVRMMVFGGGYMPAFGRLRDRQMAAIATYVRNTHGNSHGIVTEADVDAIR